MSSASDRVEERSSVRNGVARLAFTVFSILLEIVFIFFLIYRLNTCAEWINLALTILSVILVLAIYYQKQAVLDTRADFESILAVSEDVTERYTQGRGAFLRLGQLILRLFAALL